MPDMLYITLQYSNAVLVALLPHFSDLAKKLELPLPIPITTNQVEGFVPRRNPGDVGGALVLTNGWRFWYSRGHVDSFISPQNYYTIEDVERLPAFCGNVNLSTNEAITLARNALKRIGYADRLLMTTNRPTTLEGPREWRGHILPYYWVEWKWATGDSEHTVIFNVDGQQGKVTRFSAASTNLWRTPPSIDVVPELESEYRKRVMGNQQIHRREPPPEKRPPR